MHDPKLSASVAHHPLFLSESVLDKLPGGQHLRQTNHLPTDHLDTFYRQSKTLALPRTMFSSSASCYPEDYLDLGSQGRLLPLFHRLKDSGTTSEILHYPGYESAVSEAHYRYADLLHARRLYESLYRDPAAFSIPLSLSTISRTNSGSSDYMLPLHCSTPRSNIIIKDISTLPPAPQAATQSSSSSSPIRAADALSLSPLHVSTTLSSSSPLSSESSPSPLRRSSVSPDTRWANSRLHQGGLTRPNLTTSLSVPGDLALYEDRGLHGERIYPPPTSFALSSPLWHSTSSLSLYGPAPPPLMRVYNPVSTAYESRGNIGHLLDHYISSSSSMSHNHLHHHLHRHLFMRDSFYNGSASGTSLDSRSSPGKELPTKLLKQDRVRDRQELSGALDADREHSERLCSVKKSASTQTQFSSFNCENLPPPPYYTTHDTITHDKLHTSSASGHILSSHLPPPPLPPPLIQYPHTISSFHSPGNPPSFHTSIPPPPASPLHSHSTPQTSLNRHSLTLASSSPPATPTLVHPSVHQSRKCSPSTPPSLPPYPNSLQSRSPPPPPQYPSRNSVPVDVQHFPLNLSLSSASPVSPFAPPSTGPGDSDSHRSGPEEEATTYRHLPNINGSNHETAAQVSDEAIEEHFRRSLGKCYNEPPSPKKVAVHISEKISSVDDHFARALGDQMWTEIKARTEPQSLDVLSGSVDAHFAKALGAAMWKKLKAENKLVHDASSTNEQKAQSQQKEEQPNPQKSPPPSPLQTSLVT